MSAPAALSRERDSTAFLHGGGEMGALIRARDWGATPLGPAGAWPQPLKTLVALMLGANQPMFIAWGPARILLYNDAYSALMADRHPAALARPFFEVWHDIVDECLPLFARVFQGESVHMDDIELRPDRPGRPREAHFAFSYTPVSDDAGAVAGLFCVCSEITEQVSSRRREAQEAERQRAMFQQMPGFVAVLSGPDHVFEYVNDAYVAMTGPRDLVGRTIREAFPDLQGQGFDELLEHVYATGETYRANNVPLRLGQATEERFIDFMYQPLRSGSGDVHGIFVVGYEVTDRVRAEQAVREERARGEAAAREAADILRALNATLEARVAERTTERNRLWAMGNLLVATAAADGTIREANPGWRTILGWTSGELVGRSWSDLAHPEDRERWLAWSGALAPDVDAPQMESRFMHRDGTFRSVAWAGSAADGVRYVVGRDITVQREQAKALALAEEQLRQSQKMDALGQLTGGIAHDFNNMLQGIVMPLQLIGKRLELGRPEGLGRYVQAGLDSAKRAASVTQRLLAFSRRQPLVIRSVDLGQSVEGLRAMLLNAVGENVFLDLDIPQDLWTASTDAHQFESAVLNLVINARDAMPDGGKVGIRARNMAAGDPKARSLGLATGDYVHLTVADSGMGMPTAVAAQAFDPFFTTKPLGQGTGLGLSMVHGYAHQSNGNVHIESREGVGTQVHLYLPRAREPVASGIERGDAAPAVAGLRVLVAEDDAVVRQMAVEVLRDQGYLVHEAADGASAIRLLEVESPFDLIVSDVGMPGANGRQLADFALERDPTIKILLMTGYAAHVATGSSLVNGSIELLTKPFDTDVLLERLRTMLQRP